MKPARAILAIAAMGGLMAAGVLFGSWLTGTPRHVDAGVVTLPHSGVLNLVVVGNTEGPGATGRQVREAAAAYCAEARCDAVVLLGNSVPAGARDPSAVGAALRPWSELAPRVLLVPGPAEGGRGDLAALGAVLAFAQAEEAFEMPAPTWSATIGPTALFALDSGELARGGPPAELQRSWLDTALRGGTATWPVALAHEATELDADLCGRARLVLHAAPTRSWEERCATTWIATGAGTEPTAGAAQPEGTLFWDPSPGFVGVRLTATEARVRFIGADRRLGFEAIRHPSGLIALPDGTTLIQP